MEEQSDTPTWWRCDTHGPGTRTAWGCPECVRELRTSLAAATRERDEWEFAARNEAKLAQVVVRERDEARAEGERLREALEDAGRLLHKAEERFREIGQAAWGERMARACDATETALAATEPKP